MKSGLVYAPTPSFFISYFRLLRPNHHIFCLGQGRNQSQYELRTGRKRRATSRPIEKRGPVLSRESGRNLDPAGARGVVCVGTPSSGSPLEKFQFSMRTSTSTTSIMLLCLDRPTVLFACYSSAAASVCFPLSFPRSRPSLYSNRPTCVSPPRFRFYIRPREL